MLLDIDLTHKQRGIEQAVRGALRSGRLRPGDTLPSSRALAAELGVARATVVAAYEQLAAEGYVVTRPGGRTSVASGNWSAPPPPNTPAPRPAWRLDLIPGEGDRSAFPRAAWARCTRQVLTSGGDDLFGYGEPFGLAALREELAGYLARARGVDASPERIAIVAGVSAGLAELARMLVGLGVDRLAVEDPGFPFQQDVLRRNGLSLVPTPVDAEGIDVAALTHGGARSVLVTPAHQYPLGVVMSPQRRAALARWATEANGWIIEDDYDGEFRYDRQPVGALAGLAPDRVVYAGTTSKTLGGGLRLAWLVLPPDLIGPFAERRGRDCDVSQLLQATLAVFLADGHLDRHVRAQRARYRRRRDELIDTLSTLRVGGAGLEISGVSAGLHLAARLPPGVEERDVLKAGATHGLVLWPLGQHYITANPPPGLVLGFGRSTPAQFSTALKLLREAFSALS